MQITDEMLQIGLKKLAEAGLIPRHPHPVEAARNEEVLQEMLTAIFAADDFPASPGVAAHCPDIPDEVRCSAGAAHRIVHPGNASSPTCLPAPAQGLD